MYRAIVVYLCFSLVGPMTCYCQENPYNTIVNSITHKLEKTRGNRYYVSGIEINKAINNPENTNGEIKDPYNTLAGCFLFLAEGEQNSDINKQKGFVGIYEIKSDTIIWESILLSENFSSGALGSIDAIDELNQDGKVEIIIGQATGNLAVNHQLWIFNWNGKNGALITQLNEFHQPEIMYWGDKYDITDIDGDGVMEITGEWYENEETEEKTTVTYSWNGTLYGNWGATSKYLVKKGIKK